MPKLDNEKHPAIDALEEVVTKILDLPPEYEVAAYTFRDSDGGLRIAELGYSTKGGGGAWMRSDVDAMAVILAAEEFLIAWDAKPQIHGGSWGSHPDPSIYDWRQEAERGLRYHIREDREMGEWEERDYGDPEVAEAYRQKRIALEANTHG